MIWNRFRRFRHLRVHVFLIKSIILAGAMALAATAPASANPKFATIAIDARSGKILFSRNADAPRFPASLTKVMTLYLVFEDLKAGKIKLNSRIKFSKFAAARQPSKLGVRAGKSISVEQAIFALVTKSANDAATAVAETLEGSEAAFARRMTRTAKRLGMTRTTFKNASGLPNSKQKTTARDMATLGLRIHRDHPEYYKYFTTRNFKFGKANYRNHNRLLGRVSGVDGIKTGYIRASGFNLLTSARRNKKRVVAVVMGGKSGKSRNAYMTRLVNRMFKTKKLTSGTHLALVAGTPPGYKPAASKLAAAPASSAPLPRSKPGTAHPGNDEKASELAKIALQESVLPMPEKDTKPEPAQGRDDPSKLSASIGDVIQADNPQTALPPPPPGIHLPDAEPLPVSELSGLKAQTLTSSDFDTARPKDQSRIQADDVIDPKARENDGYVFAAVEVPRTGTTAPVDPSALKSDPLVPAPPPIAETRPLIGAARAPQRADQSSQTRQPSVQAEPATIAAAAFGGAGRNKATNTKTEADLFAEHKKTWNIQIGAFPSQSGATSQLASARAKTAPLLKGKPGFVMPVQKGNATLHRARFSGFKKSTALRACKRLSKRGIGCFAIAPPPS